MDPNDDRDAAPLACLRDLEPERPPAVNVARAMSDGRRTVRVRRSVGAALTAVATVFVVFGTHALLPRPVPGPDRAAGPRSGEIDYDVLHQKFVVGSAGGYAPTTYETGRDAQRVYLRRERDTSLPAIAMVTMYDAGQLPYQDGVRWKPRGERAADVNGRAAYWQDRPVADGSGAGWTGTELAWQWAQGAWAFAFVNGSGQEVRDRTHRIAESVAPRTRPLPVEVSFTVERSALGGLLQVIGVVTTTEPSSEASVLLAPVGGEKVRSGQIMVSVQRDVTLDPRTRQMRGTGPSAAERATEVAVPDAGGGLSVSVASTSTRVVAEIGGSNRLREIAESVRVLPNENAWGVELTR